MSSFLIRYGNSMFVFSHLVLKTSYSYIKDTLRKEIMLKNHHNNMPPKQQSDSE